MLYYNHRKGRKTHQTGKEPIMNAMMNQSIFEEIFDEVMNEMNVAWYELFDSEDYNKVIIRIGERFGYETEDIDTLFDELCDTLEGFSDWNHEMAMDL